MIFVNVVKKLLKNNFEVIKFLFIFLLIVLDYLSKKIIFIAVDLNAFIYITSFFDITHIHNYGISFGLLSGLYAAWVFIIISLLITIFITFMYLQANNNVEKWGLVFIIAGGLSNIADRAINGFVIDFIYFHYEEFYWPAFNFADIYISIGIIIIVIKILYDFQNRILNK